MVEFLGWIGLFTFISTLIPFAAQRLHLQQKTVMVFSRHHHTLALICLAVSGLHGLVAFTVKHGHWGKPGHLLTGVITWLVLMAVVILAMSAAKQKPFPRSHCWLVILLVVLILSHL